MVNSPVRRIVRLAAALVLTLGALIVVPACETVKGAGKDIQNAGQAGADAIDSAAGKK